MAVREELRRRREEIVREHIDAEDRHDPDAALATFHHPRYELIGTGEVHDGAEEVTRYYQETLTAFPDVRTETLAIHHADDAVLVEAKLSGTHDGPFRGLPPTRRSFEVQGVGVYMFEEDRLVCERVYFDAGTLLRQLGVARDPMSAAGRIATVFNHPITLGRAALRRLFHR